MLWGFKFSIIMILRTNFLLLILIHSVIHHIYGQKDNIDDTIKYRAYYTLTYIPDTTATTVKRESMILLIGHNGSAFYRASIMQRDSLYLSPAGKSSSIEGVQNLIRQLSSLPKTRFYYRIYKNYTNKEVMYIDEVRDKFYRNNNSFSIYNWKIYSSDTSTIAGYHCQRATTTFAGRNYEAWFTRELPLSDGPYRFAGLPGLIVKISDSQQRYSFVLNRLQDVTDRKIPLKIFNKLTIPASTPEIYQGQIREMQILAGSPINNGEPTTELRISKERRDELLGILATYNTRIERYDFAKKKKRK